MTDFATVQKRLQKGKAPDVQPTSDHGFILHDATHIFAPQKPQKWLVRDALRVGSVGLLGGYGSSGKTWLAADLALSVSTGQPWLERFECTEGVAVYLDMESGDYELCRRIQAVARARGISEPAIASLGICTAPGLQMTDPTFAHRIEALAKVSNLVVLDSLAAFNGDIDENTSAMRRGLDTLRTVAESTGCSFFVLHHTRKGGNAEGADEREVFRGSSAIFDAVDVAFAMHFSGKGRLTVKQVKSRHGAPVDPFDVTIEDVAFGVRVAATEARVLPTKAEEQEALPDKILAFIKQNPGASQDEIRVDAGAREVVVRAAIQRLEREGKIEVRKGTGARSRAFEHYPTGAKP